MENLVRQRVIQVIKENKSTVNSLSKGNSSLQRKLNRQINEGSAITIETISSILEAYPNVSTEWLLTGKGEMLKEGFPMNASDSYVPYSKDVISIDDEVKRLREELKESYIEIGRLQGENRLLREQANLGERKVNGKSA